MKIRFSNQEKGQGLPELIIGLVIIVILCLAALTLITKLIAWTKSNISEIRAPTATLPSVVTEEPNQLPEIATPTPETTRVPDEIESPVPITALPVIPTAPAVEPDIPNISIWDKFLDWLDKLLRK